MPDVTNCSEKDKKGRHQRQLMFKSFIEHSVSITDNGQWIKLMHTLKKQLNTYSHVYLQRSYLMRAEHILAVQ